MSLAFTWTDEATEIVIGAYKAKLGDQPTQDEILEANGNDFLNDLAERVGAKNAASVRRKLVSTGNYVKPEKAPSANPRAAKEADPKAWTDEKRMAAVERYTAKVDSDGAEVANSAEFLDELAEEIGVLNRRSLTSYLASAKVWVKAAPRRVGGKARQPKVTLLKEIAAIMAAQTGETPDAVLSQIEGAERADLPSLEKFRDVLKACASE